VGAAVLALRLCPMFDWLADGLGSRRLAAILVTLVCLMIVVGPVAWLGFGLIGGVEYLVKEFEPTVFSIPFPAETVKDWPLIGKPAYELWTPPPTHTTAILLQVI